MIIHEQFALLFINGLIFVQAASAIDPSDNVGDGGVESEHRDGFNRAESRNSGDCVTNRFAHSLPQGTTEKTRRALL